jgi:hypothetical protein
VAFVQVYDAISKFRGDWKSHRNNRLHRIALSLQVIDMAGTRRIKPGARHSADRTIAN